jgi:16S rRNA pseudouridine516 synthase
MALDRIRIDRFISQHLDVGRGDVRLILAQKRVCVDDIIVREINSVIDTFSVVKLDGTIIQNNTPYYVMLNKPDGVVSATKASIHKTVIDLVKANKFFTPEQCNSLHIVGRLDFHSTGLILLTNDSRWSSKLTAPKSKVTKKYRVTLANKITTDLAQSYVDAFARGIYFSFEDITTQPAKLIMLDDNVAEVHLTEGRYHQIKRMFGRFKNKVIGLDRSAIGRLVLDDELVAGGCRLLSQDEVGEVFGGR